MIQRFHGFDVHKPFTTVSVLDNMGKEINFISRCMDIQGYISKLGSEDAVVLEASTGAFYWSDLIESQGAKCFIIDPYKFKIIRDSWKKTDKHDARNMSYALWASMITDRFGLPTVYKPEVVIRELRRLFAAYELLNKQIRSNKNYVQSVFVENGLILSRESLLKLFNSDSGKEILDMLDLTNASLTCIETTLEILHLLKEKKEALKKEIFLAGEPLKEKVELLITIKGVSPLLSLAFLSDVGDVTRFTKLKQMNAYLGVVPGVKSSGGKTYNGHINRESRKLSRTLFTQSIYHVANSSPYLENIYADLKNRRGNGIARIAVIRRLFGIMRRMLLTGEQYRYVDVTSYERKRNIYRRDLEKIRELKKCA